MGPRFHTFPGTCSKRTNGPFRSKFPRRIRCSNKRPYCCTSHETGKLFPKVPTFSYLHRNRSTFSKRGAYSSSLLYHHINWSKLPWMVGVSYLVWYWSTFPERVYGLHKSNWIFLRVHRSIRSSFGTYLGIISFPKRSMGPKGSDFRSSRELVEVSLKGQWVTCVHIFAPPGSGPNFQKNVNTSPRVYISPIYSPMDLRKRVKMSIKSV